MEGNFKKWINRISSKQDVLTEDNLGQFMDSELTTKSTPTSGDTVLGRDSVTGKAVEIPTSSLGGGGSIDVSNLVPYNGATKDVNIGAHYFESSAGFKIPTGTANKALTADGGVFDLNTKADLVGGKVPASQLPAYVDDVLEYANLSSFPATGESGKIYIAIDTNLTYRWGGSSYVVMSSSLALGETESTAYRGDRGKIAYDHSQITGNPHNTTKADIGLGNVDNTSDLDKPISNATQNELNLKLSIESPSTTGTLLSFITDKVYGTLATPETSNITADVTDAKLGVTNIIIHNSGTVPTFGSQFKKLSGSGNYVTGVINYIYCTFINNTEIIYSINQRS